MSNVRPSLNGAQRPCQLDVLFECISREERLVYKN